MLRGLFWDLFCIVEIVGHALLVISQLVADGLKLK